jgi:inorganic pyrophosphatase
VLVTEPTFTGCVLAARPIGVLEMSDEAGTDEKILAVPQRDPRFDEVRSLSDLPAHLVKEVEYFFEVYKELEGKETAVLGWDDLDSAHAIIRRSIEAFREKS